jgi:2-C-methyl-D-erythritol 4-phosphate cytidylyltransferase
MPRNVAVILAGGSGSRFGLGYPKQFVKLAGRMVIEHTVQVFQEHEQIDAIVIVTRAEDSEDVLALARRNLWTKVDRVVCGGVDRFGSTLSAIECLSDHPADTKVLFHDSVRPLLAPSIVSECLTALDRYDAVDVVIPTADTVIQVGADGCLESIPRRDLLRRGQTPQGFRLGKLAEAYRRAIASGRRAFTCDCSVFKDMLPDDPIAVVEGSTTNIKITHADDLFIADKLFQCRGDAPAVLNSPALRPPALEGKTLVVFGGSSGIGEAIIEQAKRYGAHAFSFSRSTTGTDVADPAAVERALEQVAVMTPSIDFVVNTAAILIRKPLETMTREEIATGLQTNLAGVIHVALASLPYLRRTRGSLLCFTSSSYTRGRAFYSIYSSTKSAVVNFCQAVAEEWSEVGVRVNCLNPERTRTPMRVHAFGVEPSGSLLEPDVVADASLRTLVSPLTGQVIDVRGNAEPRFSQHESSSGEAGRAAVAEQLCEGSPGTLVESAS